ncbi:secreted protein [Deinococcus phoenicis]|uniref:Secreted protein n=1 Tax=Deinococcus phoenicis TaxID=1476583 RepID=A0A016QR44_9DEIO|nr:FAD-dependent oxidoreductase [Deinococcus phoenicis]EYB68580.1 secreted protein [Deinococcus phoenicis]
MKPHRTGILIVGGGVGGVAAALAALRLGQQVILTEESPWIGGQLTSQAVPPDESIWVEEAGATASYRTFRDRVRQHYREHPGITPEAAADPFLNPGAGNVGRLCHEPQVALRVLEGLLAPYLTARQLRVWTDTEPVTVDVDADRIQAVTFQHGPSGTRHVVEAAHVLDATELGELTGLSGAESVIGAEGRDETGEPHAPERADPRDQQAITWCFAVDHQPGEDHTIPRPQSYDFWRTYQAPFWPDRQLSWVYPHPITGRPVHRNLFSDPSETAQRGDFWHYRRIVAGRHYRTEVPDVTLVNWPQNDYWLGPLVGVSEEEKARHLHAARELSLSLLYWMQTEAPRVGGKGEGYPGLRLRGDLTGTDLTHGLALRPYIREARRIRALFTVTENMIGVEARGTQQGAEVFADSVGVGQYRIDLHPGTGGRGYVDVASWPFQIPLGALLPVRLHNLIAAGKTLGVTHITNGCYRLHPAEWNTGEAAGALAAFSLERAAEPAQVRENGGLLADFQALLTRLGVPLAWPDAYRLTPSPGF